METNTHSRQYSLDWLRLLMILSVFIFHSLRFFNAGDWHIKNATNPWFAEMAIQLLQVWIMPLAFVISGAGVYYALGKSEAGKYVKDKVLRLLVPLLVGIFTHSAYQIYLDRLTHFQFRGSFWEFYPHYFDGLLGFGGNFAWMGVHLWYLELLFIFCLVFLPLMLWLRRGRGQVALAWLGKALALPGAAIFLALPVILAVDLADPGSLWGRDDFGSWSLLSHTWFFLSGFVIASSERLLNSLRRLRWVWLAGALGLVGWQLMRYFSRSQALSGYPTYNFNLEHTEIIAYAIIFALLGFGMQRFNFTASSLPRLTEAVLPFYILHQPVLLSVGYNVLRWDLPDQFKWLVIAGVSFAAIIAMYELLVRRINLLRFLFGMKLLPKAAPAPVAEVVLAGREIS